MPRDYGPGGDRPYIDSATFETRLLAANLSTVEAAGITTALPAIEAKLAADSGIVVDSTDRSGRSRPDGVDYLLCWLLLAGEISHLVRLFMEAPEVIARADLLNYGERHGPAGNRTRTGLTPRQAILTRWSLLQEQVVL